MTTCTDPRTDRLVTGRFVRNLALSLSGGALLTVAGAAVASAQEAGTDSSGSGLAGTGDATAVGNSSGTHTKQGVAPSGGASNPTVVTQTAVVPNVGIAVANTGGNAAVGNASDNSLNGVQNAAGGALVTSNNGVNANVSDGTASITTGSATAYGNQSQTHVDQAAHGALGILTSQTAFVLNGGVAVANTGLNAATGNAATNSTGLVQNVTNASGLATNSMSTTNASNGTATIVTGAAAATGNRSDTHIAQSGGGTGDGDPGGLLVINQVGVVANLGAGIANSGGNLAVGNEADHVIGSVQVATVGPAVVAPLTVASNQLDREQASDGSATIHTGAASAVGNDSNTNLTQAAWGDPDALGAIVSTQVAAIGNVGVGVANTGLNLAVGNTSDNDAGLTQTALIDGANPITSLLPVTASNSATVDTTSDGSATIRTGAARATGNASATSLSQSSEATIAPGGMGVLPNTQVAAVLNAGAAVANSGVNAAIGNAAGLGAANFAEPDPIAVIDSDFGAVTALGPITAFNSAESASRSDGTAFVITGAATATGNTSHTDVRQDLDTEVDGMGLIVAPQIGVVANVGVGVANSGVNAAIGNAATNLAGTDPSASFSPVVDTTVLGPITVGNTTYATNDSDGEACACTGDATASGNVSRSTLVQDLELTAEDGFLVVPTTGLILNAGFGLANSGVNLAIGNISDNSADLTQDADLAPAAPALLVGPQTMVNGGGAGNSSDGAAKVGTGNASATGNASESSLVQAATIGGAGVIAPLTSTIANAGLGVANAGVNLGIGNASTNSSSLTQTASGTGTVANQGEATNDSDGTAQINDCLPEEGAPPAHEDGPGAPTLPRTGGAIETMAVVALMLLLTGFAAQGVSRRKLAA